MAVIHKSRCGPGRAMRRARRLMILCWPCALLSLGLAALFYWQCWGRLWSLAEGWRQGFTAWSTAPGAGVAFHEEWHQMLWTAAETLLRGVGWGICGLTVALPGLLGAGVAILFLRLFRPVRAKYMTLREQVRAVSAAQKLLSTLPGSCHIFLHKRIVFEGTSDTQIILVGPGGVVVMEVRNEAGIIEGCVTDAVLRQQRPDGDVEKLRNPARPAVAGVTRLSNYLQSLGLSVHVTPCVLFVHPEASVYVTAPDMLNAGGRRTRISTCVMTDATSFWEEMGRSYANGRVLRETTVEQLVAAIVKAPEGRKRKAT